MRREPRSGRRRSDIRQRIRNVPNEDRSGVVRDGVCWKVLPLTSIPKALRDPGGATYFPSPEVARVGLEVSELIGMLPRA